MAQGSEDPRILASGAEGIDGLLYLRLGKRLQRPIFDFIRPYPPLFYA